MNLMGLSMSDIFRYGVIGRVGDKIAIVSMGDVSPEHMFVEGYIVSNIYWLGLLVDFYIINL